MRPVSAPVQVATAALACLGLTVGIALAQVAESEGGLRLEGGLNLRVQVENGDPEFRTGFDLDLISATRTQRLSFSGDFGLIVPLDDLEASDFSDPRYGIDYLRDTGRSRITLSAFFQQTDVDGFSFTLDDPETPFDETALIDDSGTRETRRIAAAVAWGLQDPIGGRLSYSRIDTLYTDTSDPGLVDTLRQTASAGLTFTPDPTLSFRINGSWRLTEEDDAEALREERLSLGLGATWEITPAITVEGDITPSQLRVARTLLGTRTETEQTGLDLLVGLSLERPNGGYRFEASRSLERAGDVNSADVTRNFSLPRGAEIRIGAGVIELPSGTVYGTGRVSYDRDTARGALALSLEHDAAINSDAEEVLRTIVRARYSMDLAGGARWSLSGRLTDSRYEVGVSPDITSARLSLDYARPLTENWDLLTGLTLDTIQEGGVDDRRNTTVFLSLERRFSVRP